MQADLFPQRSAIGDNGPPEGHERFEIRTYSVSITGPSHDGPPLGNPSRVVHVLKLFARLDGPRARLAAQLARVQGAVHRKPGSHHGRPQPDLPGRVAARCALYRHRALARPSGSVEPSPEDRRLATEVANAGVVVDVPVLDHVIVTPDADRYFSFTEEKRTKELGR